MKHTTSLKPGLLMATALSTTKFGRIFFQEVEGCLDCGSTAEGENTENPVCTTTKNADPNRDSFLTDNYKSG
jgi:hypothetical protein